MRMLIYLLFVSYFVLENPKTLQSLDLQPVVWFAPGILAGLLMFYGLHRQELSRKLLTWLLLLFPLIKPAQTHLAFLPQGIWTLMSFLGGYLCIYFYLERKFPASSLCKLLWSESSVKQSGLSVYFANIFKDILTYVQILLGLMVVGSFSLLTNLVSSHSILSNPWIDGSVNLLIATLILCLMEPVESNRCN